MPTLVRLLTILGLVAGAVYAVMAALVVFVEPTTRPVTVEIAIPARAPSEPPAAVAEPKSGAIENGSFEAQATPSGTVDPNVTGGTLRP